jgi:hypothetical protein
MSNLYRASGQYCDTLRQSWLGQERLSQEQECSDCILGGMQTDLNSPFGYDERYEADFRARTSSCNKLTYTFTTPGSETVPPSTTTTTKDLPTPSCVSTYAVSASDTCASIALRFSVSTWSIIKLNGLDPQCNNLQSNSTLCLGTQCPVHQIGPYDTCDSIVADAGGSFTGNEFAVWNPNVDSLCYNLHDSSSNVVCVG